MAEKKVYYSEIFHSIQGEGHYTGVPTAWIRFFLCNLQCSGFGQIDPTNPETYDLPFEDFDVSSVKRVEDLPVWEKGCDSSYTWAKKFKQLMGQETPSAMANKIVNHGLANNLIKELTNIDEIKPEVFFNKETRFDFLIAKNSQKSFVEVKNVTLFRDEKTAEFPDAITTRGSKHLITLIDAIKKGYKAYLIFLVQIQNMEKFKIAKDIDSEYYKNYLAAKKAGVNFLAYRCKISSKEILIEKKLEIKND